MPRIASFNTSTKYRSPSSLTFTWEPPKNKGQHSVKFNYTTCLSKTENGVCFLTFKSMNREWTVQDLNASTKYFIKILANGTMGQDFHGESAGFYTNGGNAQILNFPYNYIYIIHIPIANMGSMEH